MTPEVFNWVKSLGLQGRCLDIGSFDVNGSVRPLFKDYVGLDMRQGPGVDVQASAHCIPRSLGLFDVVTCLEMLEHDDDPDQTVINAREMLRTGGRFVVSVPGIGFPRHDYPSDYWRFTEDGLQVLLRRQPWSSIEISADRDHVYGVATL